MQQPRTKHEMWGTGFKWGAGHHWHPAGDNSGIISECTVLGKMSGGHYLPNRVTE